MSAHIETPGNDFWHMQAYYHDLFISSGTRYVLSLKAKGTPGARMRFACDSSAPNYAIVGGFEYPHMEPELHGDWRHFEYSFESAHDVAGARVVIEFGLSHAESIVHVKDAVLRLAEPPAPTPSPSPAPPSGQPPLLLQMDLDAIRDCMGTLQSTCVRDEGGLLHCEYACL